MSRTVQITVTEEQVEHLRQYAEWHGGAHESDCPADDTCACTGKPLNNAINGVITAADEAAIAQQTMTPPCAGCGGPYQFDTTVPSVVWNAVIRAAGMPEYLCASCILLAFVRAGRSFTAILSNSYLGLNGDPIEVQVRGQVATDAAALSEENTELRRRLSAEGLMPLTETEARLLEQYLRTARQRTEHTAVCAHCDWRISTGTDSDACTQATIAHALSCEQHPLRQRAVAAEAKVIELTNARAEDQHLLLLVEAKLDEYARSFELYHTASMALMRAYKAVHPDVPEDTWPDTAKVNAWAEAMLGTLWPLVTAYRQLRAVDGRAGRAWDASLWTKADRIVDRLEHARTVTPPPQEGSRA